MTLCQPYEKRKNVIFWTVNRCCPTVVIISDAWGWKQKQSERQLNRLVQKKLKGNSILVARKFGVFCQEGKQHERQILPPYAAKIWLYRSKKHSTYVNSMVKSRCTSPALTLGPTFVLVKNKQLQVEAPPLLRGADRRHPWPSTAINLNRVAAANDYNCSALVRLHLIRKNAYC